MYSALVLKADLLSVIIHQLDLEGARKEFELFFDLLRNAFQYKKYSREGRTFTLSPL